MRFGLYFSFQAPPELGISWRQPYEDMLTALPEAEALGYRTALTASHHVQPDAWCPSPLVAMAAAAAVTKEMRIGPAVLLAPLYAPLRLAEDAAVLDNVSGGRLVLGLAPGYVSEEFEAYGVRREERHERFEEIIDFLIGAWTHDVFSFDGRHYRLPASSVTPKPVQRPHPPIWFGVSGARSLRRAARRGVVLVASPRHGIPELAKHFRIYEQELADAGHEIPERPIIRELYVAETQAKAEEIAAPAVTYLFSKLYAAKSAQGERVLLTDEGEVIDDPTKVDYQQFKGRFIIGDPEHAINELRRYESELGATEVVCWTHIPGITGEDAMRSIRLFAREVMPAFERTPRARG